MGVPAARVRMERGNDTSSASRAGVRVPDSRDLLARFLRSGRGARASAGSATSRCAGSGRIGWKSKSRNTRHSRGNRRFAGQRERRGVQRRVEGRLADPGPGWPGGAVPRVRHRTVRAVQKPPSPRGSGSWPPGRREAWSWNWPRRSARAPRKIWRSGGRWHARAGRRRSITSICAIASICRTRTAVPEKTANRQPKKALRNNACKGQQTWWSLDIGTSKIVAIIAEIPRDGELDVIGMARARRVASRRTSSSTSRRRWRRSSASSRRPS